MNAYKLSQRYTIKELVEMDQAIRGNPQNQLPKTGGLVFVPKAIKKMTEINWAVRFIQDGCKDTY